MKLLVTLLVAALAAFAGQRLGHARAGRAPARAEEPQDLARITAGVLELRSANARLEQELERRTGLLAAAPAPAGEAGEAEIEAALARWRAAHPEEVRTAESARTERVARSKPDEIDLASVPMSEIIRALSRTGLGNPESQELFQKLRELGRIDEYVSAMEKLAAEDPENAELQVALGHAYMQKLFAVGNTPEAGPWAMKSDGAFARALELDDHNWAARFSKAVSLSNWPAFLGRGPEAIEHFETLLEQQAALPPRDEFALTYLFLGNMQQAGGEREKAIATWKAGLALFPNMDQLRSAVELAEAGGATQRSSSR